MYALPLPTQFHTCKDWRRALGNWYGILYQYPVSEIIDKIAEHFKKGGTAGDRQIGGIIF